MVQTKSLLFYYVLLFECICRIYVECMIVIPERVNWSYMNPKYVRDGMMNIRRYGRKSAYYMNLEGTTMQQWNNNVTFYMVIGEYLHNEYRPSFVVFHYKFCDLINSEPYIGGMIKKTGFVCPLPAGRQVLSNMTVLTQNFPNVFPFEKGRANVTMSVTKTGEKMMQLFVEVRFKQKT